MREVKVVPALCKQDDAPIKGHVILIAPSFSQRYEYLGKVQFKISGELSNDDMMQQAPMIGKAVSLTSGHYKEVSLVKADGTELKSFEDMQYDRDCDPILVEIAMLIVNGFGSEKNSSPL